MNILHKLTTFLFFHFNFSMTIFLIVLFLFQHLHSVSLSLSLLSLSRGDRLSLSSCSSFFESPLEDQSSDIVRAEKVKREIITSQVC